jgi:tetratricopeptide (TPR) repeat protein
MNSPGSGNGMAPPTVLHVVVASPSDVQQERDVLDNVVAEVNRGVAADRGVRLEVARWETDAYPGFHPKGPQGLIDSVLRITDCDLLIGIFWKRFGTPTSDAKSGTEHEIRIAYEAWKRSGVPQVMIYFNERSAAPESSAEADQWAHVLRFKESFPKEGLWWVYKRHAQFEKLIRNHLTLYVRNRFSLEYAPGQGTKTGTSGHFPLAAAGPHPVSRASIPSGNSLISDQLPTVEMVDLGARTHRAVIAIPYIERDREADVRAHLRAGRPVLLVGSSMVGKTRMAAEVVKSLFSGWPVVIPDSKTALADLNGADVQLRDSVVWLDDIDRLIGADGITDGAVRHLANAGNVIIGTIRAGEYDRYRYTPTDQLRPPEWDVISVFERVFIHRSLSEEEQGRLSDALGNPEIQERILRVGIGEYVGAAELINEALLLGPSVNSVGYGLVKGVADWRRIGMSRQVPASLLRLLAEPYLDARAQVALSEEDSYEAGLAWATRDINPTVSLLQHLGADAFTIYDFALDLISQQAGSVPDSTWQLAIEHGSPSDLLNVGYSAAVIYRLPRIAIQAWRKADAGYGEAAPIAAFNLAILLEQQGDSAGARTAYQKAIDSGDPDIVPLAASNLEVLLKAIGRTGSPGPLSALQARPEFWSAIEEKPRRLLFPVASVWAETDFANRLSLAQLADWVAAWERNVNLLFISGGQAEQIERQQLMERMRDQLKVAYDRLKSDDNGVIAAKLYGESLYWLDDWRSAVEIFLEGWSLMGGLVTNDVEPTIVESGGDIAMLRHAEFFATRIGMCRGKQGQGQQALAWHEVALDAGERYLRHFRTTLELASPESSLNVREQVSDAEFLLHEVENHKANILGFELGDFREAAVFYTKALARLRQLQAEDPDWKPSDVVMQVVNVCGLLACALASQPTEVIERILLGLPSEFFPRIAGWAGASAASSTSDITGPNNESAEDPVLELVRQGEDAFRLWERYYGVPVPPSHPRRANLARGKATRLLAINRPYEARHVLDDSCDAAKGFRRGLLLTLRAEAEASTEADSVKVCSYLSEAITLLNNLPTELARAKQMSLQYGCNP